MAAWFLDDGSRLSDCAGLRLNTNAYTRREVQFLSEVLSNNFSIRSTLHRARPKGKVSNDEILMENQDRDYVLYFAGKDAVRLDSLIKPLVEKELPLFLYKFL